MPSTPNTDDAQAGGTTSSTTSCTTSVHGPTDVPDELDTCSTRAGLLQVRFNQEGDCFTCWRTEGGLRVFSCAPVEELKRKELIDESVKMVEMLRQSQVWAVVCASGRSEMPKDASLWPHKVMLWDDNQNRFIGELTFDSEVRAVKLRRDRIVVVLEYKVYVYNFVDLKVLHQIETLRNVKGLCGLSQAPNHTVLACPGTNKTQVRVELFDLSKTYFIQAHENELACLSLSLDGRRLATASAKGTLIRIFDTADGTQLQELRRGVDQADIFSIAFAPKTPHLAVSSDKGTVHVFLLNCVPSKEDQSTSNSDTAPITGPGHNSSFPHCFMKAVLPKYFSSDRSLAQFRIHEKVQSYAAFGAELSVVNVVCNNGKFYKLQFDPRIGGNMKLEEDVDFLNDDQSVVKP